MKATMHGRIQRPAVAVVGVWDPLLPMHTLLLEQLRTCAAENARDSLAVAFDPDPITFIAGSGPIPLYNDARTRVRLLLDRGLDGVMLVSFGRKDVEGEAADLFGLLSTHARVDELWLGARQTFGRGPNGGPEAIASLAREQNIHIVRMPPVRLATSAVRDLLRAGRLKEAATLVGRPPVIQRPRSGFVKLAWPVGTYSAVPKNGPSLSPDEALHAPRIPVHLAPDVEKLARPRGGLRGPSKPSVSVQRSTLATLCWPDRTVEYLAFVEGPGDAS